MIELAFIFIWLLAGAVLWKKCGEFHYVPQNDGFWDQFWAGFLHVMIPFACIVSWPVLVLITLFTGGTITYDGDDGWGVLTEEDEDD